MESDNVADEDYDADLSSSEDDAQQENGMMMIIASSILACAGKL